MLTYYENIPFGEGWDIGMMQSLPLVQADLKLGVICLSLLSAGMGSPLCLGNV